MTVTNTSSEELCLLPLFTGINGGWDVSPANIPGQTSLGFSGSHEGRRLQANAGYCYTSASCSEDYFMQISVRVNTGIKNHCDTVITEGYPASVSCYVPGSGVDVSGSASFSLDEGTPGRKPPSVAGRLVNHTSESLTSLGSTVTRGGKFIDVPRRIGAGKSFDFTARGKRGSVTFGGLIYQAPEGDRIQGNYSVTRGTFERHGSADDGTNGQMSTRYTVEVRVPKRSPARAADPKRVNYVVDELQASP